MFDKTYQYACDYKRNETIYKLYISSHILLPIWLSIHAVIKS